MVCFTLICQEHCTVLCSYVLYCSVPYFTVLHFIALLCAVLWQIFRTVPLCLSDPVVSSDHFFIFVKFSIFLFIFKTFFRSSLLWGVVRHIDNINPLLDIAAVTIKRYIMVNSWNILTEVESFPLFWQLAMNQGNVILTFSCDLSNTTRCATHHLRMCNP